MRWQSALQLALQFLFGAIFGMGIERRRHSEHNDGLDGAGTLEP